MSIKEFVELTKGKRWSVETPNPDFGISVYFANAEIIYDPEGTGTIAITNNGSIVYIEECNETITGIEQNDGEIVVTLFNLPDLVFTECVS